jgi:2-keto-3-deoxy-L-fuconate dehydrogenase
MFRLDGKTTFITGAGSGIGEDTARAFAEQGAKVVIGDVNVQAGRHVAESIGPNATYVCANVTDPDSLRMAFAETIARLNRIDVLVNNAGIGLVGNVEETSDEDFERLMRVNVTGVFNGCKQAVPLMLAQGRGNIINIGSVAALVGIERRFAYSATKGAVVAMTRQLAIDYVLKGIRCNCICPGTVYTPFVDNYLQKFHAGEVEETKKKLDARQPIGRMGRPDEIAKMAVYLASDEAEFVTGAVLTIDGGLTAR